MYHGMIGNPDGDLPGQLHKNGFTVVCIFADRAMSITDGKCERGKNCESTCQHSYREEQE